MTRPSATARKSLMPRRMILMNADFYDVPTHHGVIDWVQEHGWALDASAVHNRALPQPTKVDGILTTIARPDTAAWLRKFGCPIVRMHCAASPALLKECADFPAVECDFRSAGRLGAEHLLTLGNPHFAFYQRGHGFGPQALRQSFVETLRTTGHEPTVLDFLADHPALDPLARTTLEFRLRWLAARLKVLPRPLAVMTEDDRFAPEVVEVARTLGHAVPSEIAVLGCEDNSLHHGVSAVPISSVDSNMRGVGYAAADLLARLIAGKRPPSETIKVPARRVIERQSTATYAGDHPAINAVLRRLRADFRESLTIDSLAQQAKMSVRGLQHAFKQEKGCTIQEELTRLRVAAATRLLEETDLKLDAVASDTNLGDAKNLCRVFSKMHSITPDAWRRAHRHQAG